MYILDEDKKIRIIILCIIFLVLLILYNFTLKKWDGNFLGKIKITKVPDEIQCLFGEPKCDQGEINGWSIAHFLMYGIIGYLVPGEYVFILLISLAFEILEEPFGANSKIIIDPLTNLFGYWVGSQLS